MKKTAIIIGVIFSLLILLMLVVPIMFKGKINSIVISLAEKNLNASLKFRNPDISLIKNFPKATIELEDLSVVGHDQFKKDTLIKAEQIDVSINLFSLIKGNQIEITKVKLTSPQVMAIVLENGKANWDIVKSETTGKEPIKEEKSTMNIKLNDVQINDGAIIYLDQMSKIRFYSTKINLNLSGDFSAAVTEMKTKLKAQHTWLYVDKIAYLSDVDAQTDMNIKADFEKNTYTFNKNSFKLNALDLNLDGRITVLKEGYDMDLKINTPKLQFKEILSFIPALYKKDFAQLQADGKVTLNAAAKGKLTPKTFPKFDLLLKVDNGMFKYPSMPEAVNQIFIQTSVSNPGGSLDKTIVDISKFSFNAVGNLFKATLFLRTPKSNPDFNVTANGTLDLDLLHKIYPMSDTIKLGGLIKADLQVIGTMKDLDQELYTNMKGVGHIKATNLIVKQHNKRNIEIPSADILISPYSLNLKELNAKIGNSDVKAKGEVNNYLSYLLKNKTLDGNLTVSSNILDINELSELGSNEQATVTNDTVVAKVVVIPKNLKFQLNGDFKKVLFQKMVLTDVIGKIDINDGEVNMSPLKLSAFGGNLETRALYSTKNDASHPSITMSVNMNHAAFNKSIRELNLIQTMAPIFENAQGFYSINFNLSSLLNENMNPILSSFKAKGVIEANNMKISNVTALDAIASALKSKKLRNIEAKDLKIPFTIENQMVRTSPFDVRLGGFKLTMSGSTGFDQSIDYFVKAALPVKIPGVDMSVVDLRIGGTFLKPKISLISDKEMKDALKNNIKNEVIKKLTNSENKEEQIAKIRKEAKDAGDKLVNEATLQAQKLIDAAKNPIARIAAQKGSDLLIREAEKQAEKLNLEAEKQINKFESENK